MTTYFYILENIDAEDKNVLYVGKTNNLARRLSEHKQRFGYQTLMTEIDSIGSTSRKDWLPVERYWIDQFKSWGFKLINIKKGGGGHEKVSEELRRRLSESVKGIPRPWVVKSNKRRKGTHTKPYRRIKCPYCEVEGIISNMTRWHFDNCKNKNND